MCNCVCKRGARKRSGKEPKGGLQRLDESLAGRFDSLFWLFFALILSFLAVRSITDTFCCHSLLSQFTDALLFFLSKKHMFRRLKPLKMWTRGRIPATKCIPEFASITRGAVRLPETKRNGEGNQNYFLSSCVSN